MSVLDRISLHSHRLDSVVLFASTGDVFSPSMRVLFSHLCFNPWLVFRSFAPQDLLELPGCTFYFHLLKSMFSFSPVGFKWNLSLLDIYVHFFQES